MEASLELSKQLFEVSGWFDIDNYSIIPITGDGKPKKRVNIRADQLCESHNHNHKPIPLYDLGFLIRKLSVLPVKLRNKRSGDWAIAYRTGGANEREYLASGKTPEDTCARLALALFEAGILTREGEDDG